MILTFEEFKEKSNKNTKPYEMACEAQGRLRKFCDEHWYELCSRVRFSEQYLWEGIYSHFQCWDVELPTVEEAYKAYADCEYSLEDLSTALEMTPLEIARQEVVSKEARNVPGQTYRLLLGEYSPEDCYPIPDHINLSKEQLDRIHKRREEYAKEYEEEFVLRKRLMEQA